MEGVGEGVKETVNYGNLNSVGKMILCYILLVRPVGKVYMKMLIIAMIQYIVSDASIVSFMIVRSLVAVLE